MQKVIALSASCCLRPKLAIYEKDGFSANPLCDGHVRRHRLQRIDLHSHNPASKGQQPTLGELIGEGPRRWICPGF